MLNCFGSTHGRLQQVEEKRWWPRRVYSTVSDATNLPLPTHLAYSLPFLAVLNSGSAMLPQSVSLANVDAARAPSTGWIFGIILDNILLVVVLVKDHHKATAVNLT